MKKDFLVYVLIVYLATALLSMSAQAVESFDVDPTSELLEEQSELFPETTELGEISESELSVELYGSIASGSFGENVTWSLDSSGFLVISGNGAMPDARGSGAIPWDNRRTEIKKVEIKDGVTSIAYYAFWRCTNLTEVIISDSVTIIGGGAFEYCSSLTRIIIPNSVSIIEGSAFKDCTSLTSVNMPAAVQLGFSFDNCTTITYVKLTGNGPMADFYDRRTPPWENSSKVTIEIENGITSISDGAFCYCVGLVSVLIPNTVESIGRDAFKGCSNLTSIDVPNSVGQIGDHAFWLCSNLQTVTLPENMLSIGVSTFEDCTALTSITLPNGLTKIEWSTFEGCTNLTSVSIPDSVVEIGYFSFSGCVKLQEIIIPQSVTSIGTRAFRNCTSLTSIIMPADIKTDRNNYDMFYGCSAVTYIKLTGSGPMQDYGYSSSSGGAAPWGEIEKMADNLTIEIEEGVTSIGRNAFFRYGSKLNKLIIPSSVSHIDYNSYSGYGGAGENVHVSSAGPLGSGCNIEFGWVEAIPDNAFRGLTGLTEIIIPQSVTSIGNSAFESCWSLPQIILPDGLISIGDSVFSDCDSLSTITIPSGISCITNKMFYLSGLTKIYIPDTITSIGDSAFSSCDSLTSITIPNSVASVGTNAFAYCDNLSSVTIPATVNANCFKSCSVITNVKLTGTGYMYNYPHDAHADTPWSVGSKAGNNVRVEIVAGVKSIGTHSFCGCTALADIQIPDSITIIGDYAFSDCTELTGVLSIASGVTTIGEYAYQDCTGFTGSLIIPSSVVSLGDYAFSGCTNLNGSLMIGNGVTEIKKETFSGCSGFKGNLIIGNGVKSIGNSAFSGFSGLSGSLTIPDSVTEIGSSAFSNCTGFSGSLKLSKNLSSIGSRVFSGCSGLLGNVTIFGNTNEIGEYAFSNCSGLTSIAMQEGVSSVCNYAFQNCTNLTTVSIPKSINSVGYNNFTGCSSLKDAYFNGTEEQWGQSAMRGSLPSSCVIHYAEDIGSSGSGSSGSIPQLPANSHVGFVTDATEDYIVIDGQRYGFSTLVSLYKPPFTELSSYYSGKYVLYSVDESGNVYSLTILQRVTGVLKSWNGSTKHFTVGTLIGDCRLMETADESIMSQLAGKDCAVYTYSTGTDDYIYGACMVKPVTAYIGTLSNYEAYDGPQALIDGNWYPVAPFYENEFAEKVNKLLSQGNVAFELEDGMVVSAKPLSEYWQEPEVIIETSVTGVRFNNAIFSITNIPLDISFGWSSIDSPENIKTKMQSLGEYQPTLHSFKLSVNFPGNLSTDSILLNDPTIAFGGKIDSSANVMLALDNRWGDTGVVYGNVIITVQADYTLNGVHKTAEKKINISLTNVPLEDRLKEQETQQEKTLEKEMQNVSENAANELDKLIGNKNVTIADFTLLRTYLGVSASDAKLLQKDVLTQMLLYATPKETWLERLKGKVDEKILSKVFGSYTSILSVSGNVLDLDYIVSDATYFGVNYGDQKVRISCEMTNFSMKKNNFAMYAVLSYEVLGPVDGNKKTFPVEARSRELSIMTVVDMEAFADAVYSVVASEMNSAYSKAVGDVFNLVPKKLFSETGQKIFNAVEKNTKKIGWKAITYAAKKGTVHCPVDIYIYDENNVLCASIESSEITLNNAGLDLWVEGDSKFFSDIPYDYRIEYVATANGTMTVELTEYIDSQTPFREMNFSVPLYGNVLYTQDTPESICGDASEYQISSGTEFICPAEQVSYLLEFDNADIQILGLVGQSNETSCELVLQMRNSGTYAYTANYYIVAYGENGKFLNATSEKVVVNAGDALNKQYHITANELIFTAKAFVLDENFVPLLESSTCGFTPADARLFSLFAE